jgi:hypothetical protein
MRPQLGAKDYLTYRLPELPQPLLGQTQTNQKEEKEVA